MPFYRKRQEHEYGERRDLLGLINIHRVYEGEYIYDAK
jgi:hypothetical protein